MREDQGHVVAVRADPGLVERHAQRLRPSFSRWRVLNDAAAGVHQLSLDAPDVAAEVDSGGVVDEPVIE